MSTHPRYTPCEGCGHPRMVGGRLKPGTLCHDCARKAFKATHPGRVAWVHKADRDAHRPATSWWTSAPRADWGETVARETGRMKVGGGTTEPTVRNGE